MLECGQGYEAQTQGGLSATGALSTPLFTCRPVRETKRRTQGSQGLTPDAVVEKSAGLILTSFVGREKNQR